MTQEIHKNVPLTSLDLQPGDRVTVTKVYNDGNWWVDNGDRDTVEFEDEIGASSFQGIWVDSHIYPEYPGFKPSSL